MKSRGRRAAERGFSLVEFMTATAIFVVLCSAAFGLLAVCQRSYQTESQLLSSFQEARLAVDQIVRDVNIAGYPPPEQFSTSSIATKYYAQTPFAWVPGYLTPARCAIGAGCATPGDFDLIIETNIDPTVDSEVDWVRYQLQGTTLFRGQVTKSATDPDAPTAAVLVPFVQNVINSAPPAGPPVPIFKYFCNDANVLKECAAASPSGNAPANIVEVEVTLLVQAPQPDPTTGKPRIVTLNGRGHRVNPN